MLKLIWRDLYVYQRKNIASLIITSLIYLVVYNFWPYENGVMFIIILVFSTFCDNALSVSFSLDDIYKFNRLVISLPIKRETIVLSRFISSYLVGCLGIIALVIFESIITSVTSSTINNSFFEGLSLNKLLFCFGSINSYFAIVFVLRNKFGVKKHKVLFNLVYIAFFLSISLLVSRDLVKLLPLNIIKSAGIVSLLLAAFAALALFMIIMSIMISIKIIASKEF